MPKKFSTSNQLTAQEIQNIVEQLRSVSLDGYQVFESVWLEHAVGGVYLCLSNWATVGKLFFYVSENEIGLLDIETV